jgi:membrane-associated phospholipid phosphatase
MTMEAEDAWLLDAAATAGANALAGYFAGLAILLLSILLAVRLLQRFPVRHKDHAHSTIALLARFGFGFAVIVIGAALFAGLADEIDISEEMTQLDERFTGAMAQHTPAGAVRIFGMLTHLGDTAVLVVAGIVVTLVLLFLRQRWLALGWAVAAGGNGLLNSALKEVFARMRPHDMYGMPLIDGWSFPSGHASGAVAFYGMLSYVLVRNMPRAWHLPVILLAAALAFTIGCSRIFLQFHYASDVLAGFASGSAWLAVCITTMEALRWQHVWGTRLANGGRAA